jgi:hypothetical protein
MATRPARWPIARHSFPKLQRGNSHAIQHHRPDLYQPRSDRRFISGSLGHLPVCEGCATDRGASVECDGGGFTSSEWAEQDDDFKARLSRGVYDRPCGPCKGLGRVQGIDEDAVTGWRERIFLKAYHAQERDSRAIDAIHAAERRMGA